MVKIQDYTVADAGVNVDSDIDRKLGFLKIKALMLGLDLYKVAETQTGFGDYETKATILIKEKLKAAGIEPLNAVVIFGFNAISVTIVHMVEDGHRVYIFNMDNNGDVTLEHNQNVPENKVIEETVYKTLEEVVLLHQECITNSELAASVNEDK